jgi:hypothetical protein
VSFGRVVALSVGGAAVLVAALWFRERWLDRRATRGEGDWWRDSERHR